MVRLIQYSIPDLLFVEGIGERVPIRRQSATNRNSAAEILVCPIASRTIWNK